MRISLQTTIKKIMHVKLKKYIAIIYQGINFSSLFKMIVDIN